MKFFVSQIGAREHYAVARALHREGRLGGLFTDFWASPSLRRMAQVVPVGGLVSLAGRWHPDFEKAESGNAKKTRAEIVSWNWRALAWEAERHFKSRKRKAEGGKRESDQRYRDFIETGKEFSCSVRDRLKRSNLSTQDTIFFGYDTGALETLEYLKERGVRCVVDQMDPNRVEVDMVREEEKKWPGWATTAVNVPEEYFRRREQEWALADRVVVNSEYSRRALIQQGVPESKLMVVPLCFESEVRSQKSEVRSLISDLRPLKILFLGQVILRKGIQYLMEAARLLLGEPVHFDVVGPLGICADAVNSAPGNMKFHGRVNRDQARVWYQNSDVFILPTLSDGFALTQLEAMAHGLPVITTPNCGAVVTDNEDGIIVAPREAAGLVKAIQCYLHQPELLRAHQAGAQKKVGQFTFASLGKNLAALEAVLLGKRKK